MIMRKDFFKIVVKVIIYALGLVAAWLGGINFG